MNPRLAHIRGGDIEVHLYSVCVCVYVLVMPPGQHAFMPCQQNSRQHGFQTT